MKLRTKLLIAFTTLLAVALVGNYVLVASLGRRAMIDHTLGSAEALSAVMVAARQHGLKVERSAEELLGDQMIVQATLAAHLVDVAENFAHLSTEDIKKRLKDIADRTVLDEFWITDARGHAYLRNIEEIDFAFPSVPTERNQAWQFWHLLDEERGQFVQAAMKREYDGKVFKYAGVSGLDGPRIVQVGFNAASLKDFVAGMTSEDLARAVVGEGGLVRCRAVGPGGELYMDTDLPGRPAAGERIRDGHLLGMIRATLDTNASVTWMDGDRVVVVSPAKTEGGSLYGVVCGFDVGPAMATIRQALWFVALIAGAVLLAGVILAIRASRDIAQPLQALADEAAEIGQGRLDREVRVKADGEVGALADAFNKMVASLKGHIEELRHTTAAKEQLESEIRIAARVQTWMLPRRLPTLPGVRVFASTTPARLVGGDFYDFVQRPDGQLCLTLGDASGKGLPGALYASQSLSVLRALALRSTKVGEILSGANVVLLSSGEAGGLFATIFYGAYDPRQRVLDFVNAGHCPPILVRRDEPPALLEAENSLPIGLTEGFEPFEQQTTLELDDLVVLYSDGVTDARNPNGEFFGQARLLECLRDCCGLAPREIVNRVGDSVWDFTGGTEPTDDITVVALQATA